MQNEHYSRLMNLATKHEEIANQKFMDYMDNGSPSTLRTYHRHLQTSEDYRDAARAQEYKRNLAELRATVNSMRGLSGESLEERVRSLHEDIDRGYYI